MKNNKDKSINESPFKFFRNYTFFAVFGLLVLGFLIGVVSSRYSISKCHTSFELIDVSEVCGKSDVIRKTDYITTQKKLETFIADQKSTGHLVGASVYFRDLEDGPIFGIDENADFAPASLLKLPLALVYLTQAEGDPSILKEQLSVANPDWSFVQTFFPDVEIDPKVPHTVENLIMNMLEHSDNNAYGVLQKNLHDAGKTNLITQTFLELGFINPTDINDEVLSVRGYAAIFRALYHLSYLNAELSEKVLGWLSQATFTQGLDGGVPADIVVAHKFGERFTPDGNKQLHDCGIVYYPGNPYLLCVMTRGTNFDDLASVIRHISEEVYKEVDSRHI